MTTETNDDGESFTFQEPETLDNVAGPEAADTALNSDIVEQASTAAKKGTGVTKKSKFKKIIFIVIGLLVLAVVGAGVMDYVNTSNEQARIEAAKTRAAEQAAEDMRRQQEDAKKRADAEEAARKAAEGDASAAASQASSLQAQFKKLKTENADLKKKVAGLQAALAAKPKIKVVEKIKTVEKIVEKPVPAPEPPKEELPRSHCEFKGSLVNRAWLVCDGKLISVKVGDPLPYPYREVVKVNDGQSSGGSVLTTGGVIE